jgi:hypothetical protein
MDSTEQGDVAPSGAQASGHKGSAIDCRPLEVALKDAGYELVVDEPASPGAEPVGFTVVHAERLVFWLPADDRELAWRFVRAIERGMGENEAIAFVQGQPMTKTELLKRLRELDACEESIAWLDELGVATAEQAWLACDRVDWLLWLAGHAGLRSQVVSLAADYAERVLPRAETWLREHAPQHADAPRRVIEAARSGDYRAYGDVVRAANDATRVATYAAVFAAAAERTWQLARLREAIVWADVERGLRGAA